MQLSANSKVIVQGITEPLGKYWTSQMKAYGTQIIAGVSAGQGGDSWEDIPIFDLVEDAIAYTKPEVIAQTGIVDATIIFDQPYKVLDTALEAIDAGISNIIIASEKVPPSDIVYLLKKAQITNTSVLGPSQGSIIIPEQLLIGSLEPQFYSPGSVGIIGRSNSLTNEIAYNLTTAKLGQSWAINLGNEGMIGLNFRDWLEFLENDAATEVIVIVGQPQSSEEEIAAEYIPEGMEKPVVAYLAGHNAPSEQLKGDAGIIIAAQLSGTMPNTSSIAQKITALKQAKVAIAQRPSQVPDLVKKALKKK